MFKIKKIFILFILIYFCMFIPKTSAKYISLSEIEFDFQFEIPDTKFDSIIVTAPDIDDNGTIFTINAIDNQSGINKIEFYINGELYQIFEYDGIANQVTETIEMESEDIPFYAEFYAIGTDNSGNVLQSNKVIPNYFRIYNLADLMKFKKMHNSQEINFENKNIYLMNDIDLSSLYNWTPIGTEENPFKGNFYGNLHTISNIKIDALGKCKGFFGQNDGLITELTVSRKYNYAYV